MQEALEEHLCIVTPHTFEMKARALDAVDSRGNPLTGAFGAPNDIVSFAGTIELTCAICESIKQQ